MPDGYHIDEANPNSTFLLQYPAGAKTCGTRTWWGYEHNDGAAYGVTGGSKAEGVSDVEDIRSDIKSKDFLLLELNGHPLPKFDDVVLTNTIFMFHEFRPRKLDYGSIKVLAQNLASSLPTGTSWKMSPPPLIIGTTRTDSNEEIVLLYMPSPSEDHKAFVGFLFTATNDPSGVKDIMVNQMKRHAGGRVYVYGDPLKSIDFQSMASTAGVELIVRPATTVKDFHVTEQRMQVLSTRSLTPSKTAFVNATPDSLTEIQLMGGSASSLDSWRKIRQEVETKLSGNFSRRITTKEELFHELQFGTSDVLFVIAHSDGENLFIGGQKITHAELNALPARHARTASPRVAVLVSCFAGRLPGQQASFFQRISRLVSGKGERQYLAEILVNKGYFDQVLAPEGEITAETGIAQVQDALNKLRQNLAKPVDGLSRIAEQLKAALKEKAA